jgi:flagellar hook assembly protein FlgD
MKKQSPLVTLLFQIFLLSTSPANASNSDAYYHINPNDNLSGKKDLSDFHVEYLGDSSNVSIMNFDGDFDRNIDGQLNLEARQAVLHEFYNHQGDHYDFVVFFTTFPSDFGDAAAFNISYENDVEGIGIPLFDNSLDMGSEKLQATLDMNEISGWEFNPGSSQFKTTIDVLLHEMMHRWGIKARYMNEGGQISDLTLGRDGAHWNYFLNSHASVMYGSLWDDLGENQFQATAVRKHLSPLDLYLMGFRDASGVPDFFVIENGSPGSRYDLPPLVGTTVSGNRVNISINDVIAAEGPRIPSAQNSQHKFNFRFVLLKSPSQTVNTDDIGRLVTLQREFQKRFFIETNGVGEITYTKPGNSNTNGSPTGLIYNPANRPVFDLDDARSFIVSSQKSASGHWADKEATKVRDTVFAINLLQLYEHEEAVTQAINWLNGYQATSNDDLAWQLFSGVLSTAKKAEVVSQLLENINDDGGWGLSPDSESSIYDTALVVRSLIKSSPSSYTPSSQTRLFIENNINTDSGVGYVSGGVSTLTSSVLLLEVLHQLDWDQTLISEVAAFIVNQQNPNGGFGLDSVTVHETAQVIDVLAKLNDPNYSQVIGTGITQLGKMQSVDGSFEGSVYSSATASLVLMNDSRPNLELFNLSFHNNAAVFGEKVTLSFDVRLDRSESLENVEVGVFDISGQVSSMLIPVLNPDEILSLNIALDTTSLSIGSTDLVIAVDAQNIIVETNEYDNAVNFSLEVIEQSSTPELTYINDSISFQPTYINTLPLTFELSFEAINLSTSSLQLVDVALYKRIDGGQLELVSVQEYDMGANLPVVMTLNDTIEDGFLDSYEYVVRIDPDNQHAEVNELNNEFSVSLTQDLTLDFEVLSDNISVPNAVYVGQPATISYAVRNAGTVASPAYDLRVSINDGVTTEQILLETLDPIAPGGLVTFEVDHTFGQVGFHEFQVEVDTDNVISEANESNNIALQTIEVEGNNLTNLSVINGGIQTVNNPGLEGQAEVFSVTVLNTSTLPSGDFDLLLLAQKFNEAPFELSVLENIPSIPGGGSQQLDVEVAELNFSGNVLVIATVDPDQLIEEFDESDNTAYIDYQVLSKPDAQVSSGGVTLNPSVPVAGETLTVDVNVSNAGEQDIATLNANLYTFNSTTQAMVLVGSDAINTLVAGDSNNFTFDFTFPSDAGIDQLKVVVDENDEVDEGREHNNTATIDISQQDSEFYINNKYFSPNGDGQKDTVQIIFNLAQTDNYQITIRNELGHPVKKFEYSQLSQTSFGDVLWDGRSVDGTILPDGLYTVHIIGQNTYYENEVEVWLDTNRSSLANTLKDDAGVLFDLNCVLNEIIDVGVFSHDKKYLYVSSYEDKDSQQKYGVYRIKADASEIKPMLPESFTATNRVRALYQNIDGQLIFRSNNPVNDSELWILNPNTLVLNQLSTTGIDDFEIFDFSEGYLTTQHYVNGQYNFNRISLNPTEQPTNIDFLPHVDSTSRLKRVADGWVWWIWNSDKYDVYFRSDINSNSVSLGSVEFNDDIKISTNKRFVLLKGVQSIDLFRIDNGISPAINIASNAESIDGIALRFLPNNHVLLVDEKINVFDDFGARIIQVDHPFNYEFFVEQIIQEYGSLDNLIHYSEFGDIIYSLDDLEGLQVRIIDLNIAMGGDNELFVKFSAKLIGNLYIESGGYYEEVSFYNNGNPVSKKINYSDYSNVNVLDLNSTAIRSPLITENLSHYFSMGPVIYEKNAVAEPAKHEISFLDDYFRMNHNPNSYSSTIINQLLVKNTDSNTANTCTPVFSDERAIYQSKNNLTTFLSANVLDHGVELTGSVFDQFLAQYIIEWKRTDQTGSDWNFVMSGQQSQVNELFNHWVPPAPGIYTIRLSAYDQAGNITYDEVEVVVGSINANIKNLEVDPRYISPNSDGVQEVLNIAYDLIKPVNVLAEITYDSGVVVKTIVRNYVPGMINDQFSWDGTNDSGQLVADGEYFLVIEGMRFPVTVDVENPDVELQVTQYLTESCCFDGSVNAQVRLIPNLAGEVNETAQVATQVERFDESSGLWKIFRERFNVNPYNFDELHDLLLRGRAIDKAGNQGLTQEVSVEINKAVPVDIKRIVEEEGEAKIYQAPIRLNGVQVKHIETNKHPQITNTRLSEHLGITIQAKTFDSIQSIAMKTSYLEVIDDEEVVIENTVPLELADLAVASTYIKGGSLVEVPAISNMFRLSNRDGEFYVYFVQIDQDKFPNTSNKIRVELVINYSDETIIHPFDITFSTQHEIFKFVIKADFDASYRGSLLATQAFEHMEQVMFGHVGQYDLWFFSEYVTVANNPKIIVYEQVGFSYEPIDEIELHYEEQSSEYISQYFKWAPEFECEDINKLKFVYLAEDEEGNVFTAEYKPEEPCVGVAYFSVYFDANAYCDNNAPIDPTLKVELQQMTLPDSVIEFPPHKFEVLLEDSAGFSQLIYEEEYPELVDGVSYDIDIEIDRTDLNHGVYKLSNIFHTIEQTPLGDTKIMAYTFKAYIEIENNIAISEISQPAPNQKLCAVDSEEGRRIPVNFISTLTTGSPYLHSFAQITNGEYHGVSVDILSSQDFIEYEEENNYKQLQVRGADVSETIKLYADPNVETTTLLHEVINSTGVSYCSQVELVVDAKLDAEFEVFENQFVDNKLLLSPDNDGVNDLVTIGEITAGEDINVRVELYSKPNSDFVGLISNDDLVLDDQLTFSWDGTLNGAAVDDGKYYIKVIYHDSCLLTETHEFDVIVDTTEPVVNFVSPVNGGEVGFITDVETSVIEENFDTVSIAFFYNDVWNPIATDTQLNSSPDVYEVTGALNLMGLPQGTYSLRLLAQDLLGYSAEAIIDVTLPLEQNIFWQYQHSPQYISPNADGVQDHVQLTLGLNMQSDLIIDVQDNNLSTVNVLDSGHSYSSGRHQLTWDGRDSNGQVVSDGQYGIRTQAAEVGQPLNNETMTVYVNVDSTSPAISYSIQDGAVIKGEGAIALTLVEANLKSLVVYGQSVEPLGTENLLFSDLQTGTFDVLPLSDMGEHVHQIRTTAKDKAGNVTESAVGFEIDNTAPVINLITPENQSFLGVEADSVLFSGEITEKNFSSFEVFISPEVEPAQWQSIHQGSSLIYDQFNLEWPISVADGKYLVRIQATDQAGWESEVIHQITIDRLPPEVTITQPASGSLHGGEITINGTVSDLNLSFYHLSYHVATNQALDQWQLIHTGIEPVIDDLLHDWSHSLDSGDYLLRLYAEDEGGLSSETIIELSFDTDAPASPLYLEVELVNQQDAHLSWQASSSNDLAGYRIYRNNILLNQNLLTGTSYQDLALAEGEYTYYVVAVDTIGNNSLPSNAITLDVDRTGPITDIQNPSNNQVVSGVLDVIGTASSPDDFFKYELFYRGQNDASPGTLIGQSTLPVIGQLMAELDTSSLVDGDTYIVRLEAQDTSQNLEVAERSFVIDNTAPAAPINLTYQLTGGNDVELNWNANSESDLIGYLVYRNGVIISGNGTVASSLITSTNYQDMDVVDGLHTYHVVAVDAALNVSGFSNTVDVDINTRVPDAYFTAPADGHEFETQIRLDAASDDTDIASMLFEYSVDGNNWLLIREDTDEPFYALFNPVDFGLSFGNITFRVTATDQSAQVDPSPDELNAIYKDLTPPGPVAGLTGVVTGGEIQLNWSANAESDLAGYLVSRKRLLPNPEDDYILLTSPFIVENSYLDDALADGTYSYRVSTIDTSENQSEWVDSADLTVFSITLDQPYSPLLSPATTDFTGQSEFQGDISSELTNNAGTSALTAVPTDQTGQFVIGSVALDVGDNELTARQTTAEGHTSKDSSATVQLSPTPLIPVNPQPTVDGFDLTYSWEAPDAGTVGYVPYINNQPYLPKSQLTENLYPSASSNSFATNRVLDGDEDSYWYPSYSDRNNGLPVYFQVNFQSAKWITKVEISWSEYSNSNVYEPNRYMLQYLSPVGWITQADFSGVETASVTFESNVPYLTEAIRIWIPMDENDSTYIELSEIEIFHQPFTSELNYQATLNDGNYDFQVSAINSYGFESELTAVQSLIVGDVVAPEPVVLQATVENGNQAALQWTESSSGDIAHYRVYRNNELIYTTADATTLIYTDIDLANGLYQYHVVAVDTADNLSVNSNVEEVAISQQLLEPPTGLMVNVIETGNALSLTWDPHTNPQFSYFKMYRSLTAETGFEEVTQTSSLAFIDEGLINGVRYHYHVTAVDQIGNESLPSLVESGVPYDSVPPEQPVITEPTTSGHPITVNSVVTDVAGFGSPAVEVDLYANGVLVDTVISSNNYTISEFAFNRYFDEISFNTVNSFFAGYDFNNGSVVLVDALNDEFNAIDDFDLYNYSWAADGNKLYGISGYGSQSSLKSFGLDGEELSVLYNGFEITQYLISADENTLFYQGAGVNPDTSITENGLWVYSVADDTYTKLLANDSINLRNGSMVWLNDGELAFMNFPNGTYSEGQLWRYDISTEQLELLEANSAPRSDLAFSQDGTHLYYVVDDNGHNSIARLRLSDGQKITYSKPGIDISMPVVSQDINLVLVNFDCCDKELINIATGETVERFENIGYQRRVTWFDDGRMMFVDDGALHFIEPPGRFDFRDVELSPGMNEFYAVARKGNNLVSMPSDSIQVTLNEAALSDLEIKDSYLQLSPNQVYQGQSLTGTVLVKNASQVDVEQSRLLIELINPDFETVLVEPAPLDFSLTAGEILAVNFAINNLDVLGEYTVRVFADSNQQVFETNENNNSVFKVVQVIDDLNADLELLINDTEIAPGDELNGLVRVYNPGDQFNGSVSVRIVDEQGYAVGYDESFSISALDPQDTWQQAISWNSGEAFAGNYIVQSILYNQDGQVIEELFENFTIGVIAEYALSINSNLTQINVNESVNLEAEINYLFGNANQIGTLNWQIFNSQEQQVWSDSLITTSMSPGFNGTYESNWTGLQAGVYEARVNLITATSDVSAAIPFEVMPVAQELSLTGQINELSAGVILGQSWSSSYSIQNNGQLDLTNVPVTLSIWDSQLAQSLGEQSASVSVLAGGGVQISDNWSSDNLHLGNYVLVLHADLSGQGLSSEYLLDTQVIQTNDITGPDIVIINPTDQGFYQPNVELRASVSDVYSDVDSVNLFIDSVLQTSMSAQAFDNLYYYRFTGLADGMHQLRIEASDAVGNNSFQSTSFTVDGTLPVIEVTGVSEGGLYNSAVQAFINITELNLNDSQIVLDGVPYISGDSIHLEGSHVLMVSATDAAGNFATERVAFNIDLTPPDVIISYPENNSETNQEQTVVVGSTEVGAQVVLNIGGYTDTVTADFEGSFNFVGVPLVSGENSISIQATDLAGNIGPSNTVTVIYADDISVSGYLTAQGSYGLGETINVPWQISNLNNYVVSDLPVEVNLYSTKNNQLLLSDTRLVSIDANATVQFDSSFDSTTLSVGDHRIELRVEIDQNWQTLDVDLILLQDVTGPVVTVIEPVADQISASEVELLLMVSDEHSEVDEVNYMIGADNIWFPMAFNGSAYEGLLNLSGGQYQVTFRADDIYNNETTVLPIQFTVDDTAPEIDIIAPVDGLRTNQPVDIDFLVTDDNEFTVEAELNQISISNGLTVSDEGEYELVINAIDEVGNQSTKTSGFVIDTTPPVVIVTSPEPGVQNTTGFVDIIGSAEDRNIITITVNGLDTTLKTDAQGGFTLLNQSLEVGLNSIVVTASDQAGNVSEPVTREVEYIQVGDIVGRVWQDDDQDAEIDIEELGFSQVEVRLTDASQVTYEVFTDSVGNYEFSDLTPGTYSVEVVDTDLLNEWLNTTNNNPTTIELVVDEVETVNFGFFQEKASLESHVLAHNIKGRMLVLTDQPTAQVDINQCIGVADYQLQKFVENDLTNGESVWAKLYDDQGTLLQTEIASFEDFENNGFQSIDNQPETSEFNLILHPVINRHMKATVSASSLLSPEIIQASYRLVLGIEQNGFSQEWSSEILAPDCQIFTSIGDPSADLRLANVGLNPPLPSDDPSSAADAPYLMTQQVMLESMLLDAGWSYQMTSDANEFADGVSSGEFVAYWLIAENELLSTQAQNDLMLAVEAGAGLLVSSGHDNLTTQFYSSMGADVTGTHLNATELHLFDSEIAAADVLPINYNEQVLKVSVSDGVSAGVFNGSGIFDPENHAVVLNENNEGVSVFAGMDWLLQATDALGFSPYAELIDTVINHIHPLGLSNELGYARAIQINLQNTGRSVDGYVEVILPPMVSLVHSEIPITPTADGFTFEYNLSESELLQLEFWLKVELSPVTVSFDIHIENQPEVYESIDLTLISGERPDLSVNLTNCQAGIKYGQALNYIFEISNQGNKDIFGATSFIEFSQDLQNPNWTCSGQSGGVCNQGNGTGGLTEAMIDLPVGASVIYHFSTTINNPAVNDVLVTGFVEMPENVSDVNPGNNSGSDFDLVYEFIFKNGFDCAAAGTQNNSSPNAKLLREVQ